jgi:hypothetical protein
MSQGIYIGEVFAVLEHLRARPTVIIVVGRSNDTSA